jgi:S1-C subfamily serine protease
MPRPVHLLTAALLALAGLAPPVAGARAAGGDAAGAAFRDARGYTVRVRTEITTPFVEDEQGACQGAGFVVDARRGWILTNAHVAGRSPAVVHVGFVNGSWRLARRLYVDPFTDVAVLAIDAAPGELRQAALDCSTTPEVGESVGAFGHPVGMLFTGSRGIVSGHTDQLGPDLTQIDATVNPGNSGGPVLRIRDGRVIGIATAGVKGSKIDRLNFATPLGDICRILALLARGEDPSPPRLGFGLLQNEDESMTLQVGRSFDRERWPFEPMDRIVGVAGESRAPRTVSDLVTALRGRSGEVRIAVVRDGRPAVVVAHPAPEPPVLERRGLRLDGALIGATTHRDVALLTDAPPLMIHSVESGSTADALGLESQDMLDRVDGRRFDSLDALAGYLAGRPTGAPIRIVLQRWSPSLDRVFDHQVRDVPGDTMEWVGAGSPLVVGERP